MIIGIGIAILLTCLLSTATILSLALTAPRQPEPEQTPFTQAIIDEVQK